MSIQNKMAPVFSVLSRDLTLILGNAREFQGRVTWEK